MIRKYLSNKTNSIYFNLFISYFLIISVFVLILGFYSYWKFSSILTQETNKYNEVVKESVNKALENYINGLEKITYIVYTPETQKILNKLKKIENSNSWEYIDMKNTFFEAFYSWMGFRNFDHPAKRIFIINPDGSHYERAYGSINPNYNLLDTYIYKKAVAMNGSIVFEVVDNEDYLWYKEHNSESATLLIARKINNQKGVEDLGVMVIAIEWKYVEAVIDDIIGEAAGKYYVKDSSGKVIFCSGENLDLLKFIEDSKGEHQGDFFTYKGEAYLTNSYILPFTGWTFISVTSVKDINSVIYSMKSIIMILILISLLMGGVISIIFTRSIINPINKLQVFAGHIERGVLDYRINLKSYNEFNFLARTFNLMAERLKQMINKNYVLTLREKEAELELLHSQINPHFLYNTLNSINAYAQLHDVQEISDMTLALSDILRYSIQSSKELVKVSDEIAHIRNYLYIQNIRYDNEINIVLDIQKEILDLKMARFILQPLVENALYHGLEPKDGDKELKILGYKLSNKIVFEVIDNGIGIDAVTMNSINQYIESSNIDHLDQEGNSSCIGIINVHRRIQLIFGNQYGLSIFSKPEEGTSILVMLPIIHPS